SLISFIDFLNRNHFHISGDVMLAAKIEHLLRFGDTADHRAGKTAAPHNEAKRSDAQRLRGSADQRKIAVNAEQIDVGVYIVMGGAGVEDEIETAGALLQLVGVARDTALVGP